MKKSMKINAMLNVTRTIMKVIFPLITFPYISRVIQATNFGKVTFGFSILNAFLLVASFGVSTYAIREGSKIRDNKEKFEIFASQMYTINMLTTAISYIALLIVYLFWPKLADYSLLLLVQSFTIIFTTIGVEWIYSIYEDYIYITVRGIIVQILSLILLFVFVKNENDYIIYAGITVFANGGANLFNFYRVKKTINVQITKVLNLYKHLKPMFILFFSNLTISLYVDSDIIMLGILQNDFVVGLYSIAMKVYVILKQIIAAIIVVMLPRLSFYKENNKQAYLDLIEKITCLMILFAIPLSVGICLLSKDIITIMAGTENLSAYMPLSILSIAIPIGAVATIYGNGILLMNNGEKYILISTLIGAIVNIGLNIILIPLFAEKAAAITTVISEVIVATINYYYASKYMKLFSKKIKKALTESILESFFIFIVIYLVHQFITSIWLIMILSGAISLCIYVIILLVFKEEIFIKTLKQVKNKIKWRSINA